MSDVSLHPLDTRLIMIVDDDVVVLEAMERLVANWGHRPIAFAEFEEARDYLSQHAPDALVVDIRLGAHNGLQLIHLAKRNSPSMVVVAVSGFDDSVLRAEAARAGAAYLLKPLDLEELRRHLRFEGDDSPSRPQSSVI